MKYVPLTLALLLLPALCQAQEQVVTVTGLVAHTAEGYRLLNPQVDGVSWTTLRLSKEPAYLQELADVGMFPAQLKGVLGSGTLSVSRVLDPLPPSELLVEGEGTTALDEAGLAHPVVGPALEVFKRQAPTRRSLLVRGTWLHCQGETRLAVLAVQARAKQGALLYSAGLLWQAWAPSRLWLVEPLKVTRAKVQVYRVLTRDGKRLFLKAKDLESPTQGNGSLCDCLGAGGK